MNSAKEKILKEYEEQKETYERLCGSIAQIIESLLKKEKVKYASISTRIKEDDSIAEKIERKDGKYKKLSDITDIAGIRIITYYADDVDKVAKLLEREFTVDWDNSIDKRKALEPNVFGYLSLHYIIQFSDKRMRLPEYDDLREMKAEVQIRSILQHAWAEMEHDTGYKTKIGVPEDVVRDFSRLAGLLELADKEFMEIRSKINAYRIDVEKKLLDSESDDEIKLDKISLETLLRTDKEFIDYRKEFERQTGILIDESKNSREEMLSELGWLKIFSVQDLRKMLKEEKQVSLELGKFILSGNQEGAINLGISIFYLCYAKLLRGYPKEEFVQYMRDNHIGVEEERTEFANRLYDFYRTVKDKIS